MDVSAEMSIRSDAAMVLMEPREQSAEPFAPCISAAPVKGHDYSISSANVIKKSADVSSKIRLFGGLI